VESGGGQCRTASAYLEGAGASGLNLKIPFNYQYVPGTYPVYVVSAQGMYMNCPGPEGSRTTPVRGLHWSRSLAMFWAPA
jgi:hypothetical protein